MKEFADGYHDSPEKPCSLLPAAQAAAPVRAAGKGRAPMTTLARVYSFYRDGFRSMVLGRTLWKLIALKLFILFAVLKLFFFSNFLEKNFPTDRERSAHVLDNLTRARAAP
jgi:hypothetical protein